MRHRLLDFLACPECGSTDLRVASFEQHGDEVIDGTVDCQGCQRQFPIIGGIPRMLPDALIGNLRPFHPAYFATYGDKVRDVAHAQAGVDVNDKVRTLKSFSFQWRTFKDIFNIYEPDYLEYIHPLTTDDFRGKIGLDAGCGFGRHMHFTAKYAAEIVGMDLSEAVEAAYENTAQQPNAHVVQGDIYNPPFRKDFFDFAYSIGVIHHLPDPPGGFKSLVRFVRPGGKMHVWIYGPRHGLSEVITRIMRRFTTRMDYRRLYVVCVLVALLLRVFSHIPYRIGKRFAATRNLVEKLPFVHYARYPFKAVVADSFDRFSVPLVQYYTDHQVEDWFKDAHFKDVVAKRRYRHNESWRVLGTKPLTD